MTGFLGTDEFKSMTSWQRSWGRNTITMSAAILRCKWDSCVIRAVHLWLSRICSLQIHSCSYLKSTDHVTNTEGKCNLITV